MPKFCHPGAKHFQHLEQLVGLT